MKNNLFVSYVNGFTIRFSCPQTMTYRLFFFPFISALYKPKFSLPSSVRMFTEPFLKKILMTPIIYIQPAKIKFLTHHQCVCWFPHISMGSLNPFFLFMHCLLYWKPIALHHFSFIAFSQQNREASLAVKCWLPYQSSKSTYKNHSNTMLISPTAHTLPVLSPSN